MADYSFLRRYVCAAPSDVGCNSTLCTISADDVGAVIRRIGQGEGVRKLASSFSSGRSQAWNVPIHGFGSTRGEHGTLQSALERLLYSDPAESLCSNPLCTLGPHRDGGWPVCVDESHLSDERRRRGCVVYSIGIQDKPFFDVAASAGLGCDVHMFDHTVSKELGRMLNNLHERAHSPINL